MSKPLYMLTEEEKEVTDKSASEGGRVSQKPRTVGSDESSLNARDVSSGVKQQPSEEGSAGPNVNGTSSGVEATSSQMQNNCFMNNMVNSEVDD